MPATFTPSDVIDMNKERDWAANLGMMDWDSTRIVFTKRTLLEFLKYTGTTVDTNFSNISKLPRYAKFGKITEEATAEGAEPAEDAATATTTASAAAAEPEATSSDSSFRPSRRVRTAPGGDTHDLFGHTIDDDALSAAPPKSGAAPAATTTADAPPQNHSRSDSMWDTLDQNSKPGFRPTRRVRENPGGRDSIADLL